MSQVLAHNAKVMDDRKKKYERDNQVGNSRIAAKDQSDTGDRVPETVPAKAVYSGRVSVCITSFVHRTGDADSFFPKYHIDCLRYAGIISDDTEAEIELTVRQKKIGKSEQARTEILITPLPYAFGVKPPFNLT